MRCRRRALENLHGSSQLELQVPHIARERCNHAHCECDILKHGCRVYKSNSRGAGARAEVRPVSRLPCRRGAGPGCRVLLTAAPNSTPHAAPRWMRGWNLIWETCTPTTPAPSMPRSLPGTAPVPARLWPPASRSPWWAGSSPCPPRRRTWAGWWSSPLPASACPARSPFPSPAHPPSGSCLRQRRASSSASAASWCWTRPRTRSSGDTATAGPTTKRRCPS